MYTRVYVYVLTDRNTLIDTDRVAGASIVHCHHLKQEHVAAHVLLHVLQRGLIGRVELHTASGGVGDGDIVCEGDFGEGGEGAVPGD